MDENAEEGLERVSTRLEDVGAGVALSEVLEIDESFVANVERRAWSLLSSGRTEQARMLLEGLVALCPERGWPRRALARVELSGGSPEEAVRHLVSALQGAEAGHQIRYELAQALVRQGEVKEAKEQLEEVVNGAPEGAAVVRGSKALLGRLLEVSS